MRALKMLLAMLAVCGFSTLAKAKCTHPPVNWKWGEKATLSVWTTTDGSSCATTHAHPEDIQSIDFIIRPKFGVAGRSGPFGVGYQPNRGFKGTDEFAYTIKSTDDWLAIVNVKVISK